MTTVFNNGGGKPPTPPIKETVRRARLVGCAPRPMRARRSVSLFNMLLKRYCRGQGAAHCPYVGGFRQFRGGRGRRVGCAGGCTSSNVICPGNCLSCVFVGSWVGAGFSGALGAGSVLSGSGTACGSSNASRRSALSALFIIFFNSLRISRLNLRLDGVLIVSGCLLRSASISFSAAV